MSSSEPSLCLKGPCKQAVIYTIGGQRKIVCIVTAERMDPWNESSQRVSECSFYREVGDGKQHYIDD
jgi:hypothetical protein